MKEAALTPPHWPQLVTSPHFVLVVLAVVVLLSGCGCRAGSEGHGVFRFQVRRAAGRGAPDVYSVAFDSSGRFLAAVTGQGLLVWDLVSGQRVDLPPPSLERASAVAFCPTAPLFAVATRDEQVSLRSVGTWRQKLAFPLERPKPYWNPHGRRSIFGLAITPDGSRVIAGTTGGYVHVWDAHDGHRIRRFKAIGAGGAERAVIARQELGDEPSRKVSSIGMDPQGEWFITAGLGLEMVAWQVDTGTEIADFFPPDSDPEPPPPFPGKIRVSSDRRVYAILAFELWTFDADRGASRRWTMIGKRGRGANSVAVDPLGRYVASGHGDGTIAIWDRPAHRAVEEWDTGGRSRVRALAWSPDGQWIASGSFDGVLQTWRVQGSAGVSESQR